MQFIDAFTYGAYGVLISTIGILAIIGKGKVQR